MAVHLTGIGTALPRWRVSQATSAAMSAPLCCDTPQQHRLFQALYRKSQIRSRYSVLLEHGENGSPSDVAAQSFFPPPDNGKTAGPTTADRMLRYAREAAPLARQACQSALRQARLDPGDITHLITVSCTGFAAPGVDIALIRDLPLPSTIARSHIGFMGCHGSFNALRLAATLASGDNPGPVLVCAVELCSLHFAYGWDPQRIVANALFADGAAAAIVTPDTPAHDNAAAPPWRIAGHGSVILPDSEDAMTWTITDHGFAMTLSPRVPELIEQHLRPWLTQWLARHDLTLDQIQGWAIHPGGPRILQSVRQALDLPESAIDDSRQILAHHGNMSSPTILFILQRLQQRAACRPCVALGFGPGLTTEAMLWS